AERLDGGGTGGGAGADVPGGAAGVELADARRAGAGPVAAQRRPARHAVVERRHGRGAGAGLAAQIPGGRPRLEGAEQRAEADGGEVALFEVLDAGRRGGAGALVRTACPGAPQPRGDFGEE